MQLQLFTFFSFNYRFICHSLYTTFPAMAPKIRTSSLRKLQRAHPEIGITAGFGRSVGVQAGFQLAAVLCSLSIAVLGGLVIS